MKLNSCRSVLLPPADVKQIRESRTSSTCSCLLTPVFTVGIPRLERQHSRVSLKRLGTDLSVCRGARGAKPSSSVYLSTSPGYFRLLCRVTGWSWNSRHSYWIMRGSQTLMPHALLTCVLFHLLSVVAFGVSIDLLKKANQDEWFGGCPEDWFKKKQNHSLKLNSQWLNLFTSLERHSLCRTSQRKLWVCLISLLLTAR